jgi:DHA3 family macrolide efflux protein-like MFS transporter
MTYWKNFWLYATGRLVSIMGTGIQDVAVPLFILDLTGSGTAMGTFMIITMAPRLVLVPLAGVLGDRVNRKFIMVSMDFGRGILILVLAFLAVNNMVTIPVLFAAQFGMSLMNALFGPATMAMLPDLVEEEDLTRANSTIQGINSISLIVGPALGGIIYGFGGIYLAFLANGISFIASGVSELFIQYHQVTKKMGKIKEVVIDLRNGLSFVKTQHGLFILLIFALVLNFLVNPVFAVILPYVLRVEIQFSAEQYGVLQTSFMAGILLGNIILATVLAKAKVKTLFTRGLLLQSVAMLVFAGLIFPQIVAVLGYGSWTMFWVLVLTFAPMGLLNAFVNTPLMVEVQKLTPTEFRARVFSVVEVAAQGVVPIGFGVIGILLDLAPAHIVTLGVMVMEFLVVVFFVVKYSQVVFVNFENNHNRNKNKNKNEF